MSLAKRIGKVGVQAGVCDGFVGNRMLAAYGNEVQAMTLEGAMPREIDGALEAWGMAMGPLAVSDLAGLDVGYRIRKERKLTGEAAQFARVPNKIVEMGRHGQKTGAGYYKYDASRKRIVDPEIEALIRAEAEALQIKQRHIPADEIVERCLLRLANEGAKIFALRADALTWRGSAGRGCVGSDRECSRRGAVARRGWGHPSKPVSRSPRGRRPKYAETPRCPPRAAAGW